MFNVLAIKHHSDSIKKLKYWKSNDKLLGTHDKYRNKKSLRISKAFWVEDRFRTGDLRNHNPAL